MLREKAVKFAKVMFIGLMLSFSMTVLAPASPVEAEILEESDIVCHWLSDGESEIKKKFIRR